MRTRTSQERARPSSRLDSEGEEDEDDADKVMIMASYSEAQKMNSC